MFLFYVLFGYSQKLISYSIGGKIGFKNEKNEIIIPAKYDYYKQFSNDYYLVYIGGKDKHGMRRGGKYGVIDTLGNEVIPVEFERITEFSDGIAITYLDGTYYMIDKKGYIKYSSQNMIINYSEGLAVIYRKDKTAGYINKDGILIIPYKFDVAYAFSEGIARVIVNHKYGYIDQSGKLVVPNIYNRGWDFSNGVAKVELLNDSLNISTKYFYINKNGKRLCPEFDGIDGFNYDSVAFAFIGLENYPVYGFRKGFVYLSFEKRMRKLLDTVSNHGYYLLNIKGEVISRKYNYAESFGRVRNNLAFVGYNNKFTLIDKACKEVMPKEFDITRAISEGLAAVCLNETWGYIDSAGDMAIPLRYNEAESFSDGIAKVSTLSSRYYRILEPMYDFYGRLLKIGYINKSGTLVIPAIYDDGLDYSEGLIAVKSKSEWGYINNAGAIIIPMKYDKTYGFTESLASVCLNDRWGFINKDGKVVIPLRYLHANSFSNGKALVRDLKGSDFYINANGERVE